MFRRHPRLVIEAFLGLKISGPQSRPQEYARRLLKERLAFTYNAAAREARRYATIHKAKMIERPTLPSWSPEIVSLSAIRVYWLNSSWKYGSTVKHQPVEGIHVYKKPALIQNRLLHRNMLLPFMGPQANNTQKKMHLRLSEYTKSFSVRLVLQWKFFNRRQF